MSPRGRFLAVAAAGIALAAAAMLWRSARPREGGDAPPAVATEGAPAPAGHAATEPTADGGVVTRVRGPWGDAPGAFGRRGDGEAPAEGPMALAVSGGRIWVLDQVNRRVQRFAADGTLAGVVALDGDGARDLAVGRDGRLVVLDRRGPAVRPYGADGAPLGVVALAGAGFDEPESATGVFVGGDGAVFVEREQATIFRVADGRGRPDPRRPTVPGRPRKDGGAFLRAGVLDRGAGLVSVSAHDDRGRLLWETATGMGAPILNVAMLDSDAAGYAYVAAEVGREARTPPDRLEDLKLVIARVGPNGTVQSTRALAAEPAAEEALRALAVDDDGTIYWLRRTPAGVAVEAYRM